MKTILIGHSPSYLRVCNNVLSKVGATPGKEFSQVELARNWLQKNPVHLVISNIFDDDEDEWVAFLQDVSATNIPVIFTSDTFSVEMIDYAIEKQALGYFSLPKELGSFSFFIKSLTTEKQHSQSDKYLIIRHNRKFVKLLQMDILKIITEGNYSFVYLKSGEKHIVKIPLKRLMEKLNKQLIVQCHRSSAVNISFLEKLEMAERRIILNNGDVLNLGNNYKHEVKRAMESYYT